MFTLKVEDVADRAVLLYEAVALFLHPLVDATAVAHLQGGSGQWARN